MNKLAQQWIEKYKTSSSLAEVVQEGNRLFPDDRSVRYGLVMDIAEEVLLSIIEYLQCFSQEKDSDGWRHLLRKGRKDDNDVQFLSAFDRNADWASILLCENVVIVERDGRVIEPNTERDERVIEPNTERDYKRVAAHPEFKGFFIQPREARSGLDDWLFVTTPAYRNLATIRSHETDAMYIGENHAFLYLPDDPQFLTDQYLETVRLIDDIRTLVRSFNTFAKAQIEGLQHTFEDMSITYKLPGKSMRDSSKDLLSQRDQIELFRIRSEKILDLLRSTTISRFQDHSELLKEMIKESRVDDIRNSLEHNIMILDRFHAYLTDRLKRKIDERAQKSQGRIGLMVLILTFLSALQVATLFVDQPHLQKFLDSLPERTIGFCVFLGGMIGRNFLLFFTAVLLVVLLIAFLLIPRRRSRKHES